MCSEQLKTRLVFNKNNFRGLDLITGSVNLTDPAVDAKIVTTLDKRTGLKYRPEFWSLNFQTGNKMNERQVLGLNK